MNSKTNNDIQRFSIAARLLAATLLLFTNIFLFATYSVYSGNPEEFEVSYIDMLASQWWGFALIFLLVVLPGLASNRAVVGRYISFVFMLGVLSWLQSNFLLWDYGVFDGRATSWDQYDVYGWLDIALWLGLIVVSIRMAGRILPLVSFLSWILIVGQAVLLFNMAGNEEGLAKKTHVYTKSLPEAFFDMSAKQNIVHFVLDSFQTDVFLQLIEEYELYKEFSGFTLFYENAAVTPHTAFAVPAIFSGRMYDGSESPANYYKNAISDGFHSTLYDKGYTVNLIPKLSMRSGKFSNYFKIPSNYQGTLDDLKRQNTAQLVDIALFRSAPHFLRKLIFNDGNWRLLPIFRGDISVPSVQEKAFLEDYINGLRVGTETPAYHFIHIYSPHPPYVTLEDGGYAGEILANTHENFLNESRAVFKLIRQYIAKLKLLGTYDDTLIVLQADHGSQVNPVINGEEVNTCLPRLPALLAVKPPDAHGALKISDAQTSILDIAPTILAFADEPTSSVFELDTSLKRQRPYLTFNGQEETTQVSYYSINGSVFDPESCKREEELIVSMAKPIYEYGTDLLFGMTGSADPYMGIGWSPCFAQHCWTNDHQSILNLPVKAIASDLDLHVKLIPFVDAPKVPRQRIRVSVNGTQLTEWSSTERKIQTFMIRIPAAQAVGDKLQIRFEFPDAVRPRALGLGGDNRLLSAALISLRLDIASNEE